jgi:hypothetical protein
VTVDVDSAASTLALTPDLAKTEFSENVALVNAVARHLTVMEETVVHGLAVARRDVGALSIHELRAGEGERRLYVVNAFAANDPASTMRVLAKTRELLPAAATNFVGLLCLRADRADRTTQWIEALRSGMSAQFNRLYVTGGHARVVARKLTSARVLRHRSAGRLMEAIVSAAEDGTVLFGFGNFVGMGRQLVDYWDREGSTIGA